MSVKEKQRLYINLKKAVDDLFDPANDFDEAIDIISSAYKEYREFTKQS